MRTVIVDSYDSFTFNLKHYAEGILDQNVPVFRLDEVQRYDIERSDVIIFSPGPGLPQDNPHLLSLVDTAITFKKKILGVCLGHQAMALAQNATLYNLETVYHGVSHTLTIDQDSILFKGINGDFRAGRYHSWVVNEESLHKDWRVTSKDSQGYLMSMEHRTESFFGIQFHPESVLSPDGYKLMENFFGAD